MEQMELAVAPFKLLARMIRRSSPEEYVGYVFWVLFGLGVMPVSNPAQMFTHILASGLVVAVSSGRLFDAGFSRYWAVLAIPTLSSPWLFPRLIQGSTSEALSMQLAMAIIKLNAYQFVLCVSLLVFPVALALLPTRATKTDRSAA